ncbi:MAG: hypothetical protein ACTSP6_01380 [Promethearchaeota archaeon]
MLILRKQIGKKRTLLAVFLLGTIFISLGATGIAAETTYEVALEKGTELYIINQYNENKWKDTFGNDVKPDDWFEGDSDEIGAKSRLTLRNVGDWKWDTFDALMTIFDVTDAIPKDLPINNYTALLMPFFTEELLDTIFPDPFNVWEAITVKWNFETEEFDETPDEKVNTLPIFKKMKYFEEILENYNQWANITNFKYILTKLGMQPYKQMDGNDFLWQLILSQKLAIARPFNKYLNELIDEIDADDAKIRGSTIKLDRKEKEDYTVEVSFNEQGIMSSFVIKIEDDRVIYEIIIDDTYDIVLFVFIGIAGVAGAALVGIIHILTKRTKKFKE